MKKKLSKAMAFIVLLGVVSLFSDMTHEGAAGVRGAYLSLLGASAATIGFVSGLGEMIGYSLRLLFGIFVDKTRKYWPMTILGYVIDVMAVPALALVHQDGWKWACGLLLIERMGKAIKKPAKDTILSFAASREGAGRSFAMQEALDQLGAFAGPMLLYGVMLLKNGTPLENYRTGLAVLVVPALLTVAFLLLAMRRFPHPEQFEKDAGEKERFVLRPSFILFMAAVGLFAFGFVDFSLISMHVARAGLFDEKQLPLLYAGAMAVDAVAALYFGTRYDKKGIASLALSTAISSLFAVFVFGFGSRWAVMVGVALWGIGMGAQESVMKAAVSSMVSKKNRAAGYGVFECGFGLFWFLGSWLLGALYDADLTALIVVSVGAQWMAVALYRISERRRQQEKNRLSAS